MQREIELYLHIPFCERKCNYCDFLSGTYGEEVKSSYVDSLLKEIEFMGKQLQHNLVSSVYMGGGTPSVLKVEDTERIMQQLQRCFRFASQVECSIECNPGTVQLEKLQQYRKMGWNRLSIGLQSAQEQELKVLGRIHDVNDFLHTFDWGRKASFFDINVDLMTGIPLQTMESLGRTLHLIGNLKPEHVSSYSLIVEPNTPFYETYIEDVKRREQGLMTKELPGEELEYQLSKFARERLLSYGYEQYEISNYAKPGFACAHNIGYWTRQPYIGMGIGAASFYGEVRMKNTSSLTEYMNCTWDQTEQEELFSPIWAEVTPLTQKDAMEEFMYLGLRMKKGVSREEFYQAFGKELQSIYGMVIRKLQQQELVFLETGWIRLTQKGEDLSNYVLSEFLLD